MYQRLIFVTVSIVLLAACSSSETTGTSGIPNGEAAVSAATRSADEAFREVPEGYVDCGSTNLASGWPTTTVFFTDPGAACILSAAESGEPSQHAFFGRDAGGQIRGWIVRVNGPGDISTLEYSVDVNGNVVSTETACTALIAGPVGPPTCEPGP